MSSQSAAPSWDEIRGILKEVSASQRETARQIKEFAAERREASRQLDQQIKEVVAERRETDRQMKETDRQMKETDRQMKETDRKMKETSREVKSLSHLFRNQWGSLVESLVRGKIVTLLRGRGIEVTETVSNIKIHQIRPAKGGGIRKETVCELDIAAESGSECVAVEVKSSLRPDDPQRLAKLLPRLSALNPKRFKGKRVYGALAYLKSMAHARGRAEDYGFFLIAGTGDSAHIVNGPDFQPKAY